MFDQLIISSLALLAVGISLRISMRLLYGARGPSPDDVVYLLMRILGWGLILVPMIALAVGGTNWLSFILFAATVEAFIELLLARRAAQRQAVWRLIAGAVAGGQSLTTALRIHQRRFSGIVGRAQRRLTADLERGVPWQTAIWQNRGAVPREAPAFAAMSSGQAGERLPRQLEDLYDPVAHQLQQQAAQRFMYLGTIAVVMAGVLTFVMIKIVPSFQAIFEDFDLQLPAITVSLITFANAMSAVLAVPAAILAIALVPALLFVSISYLCDIPVLQPLTDRLMMYRHRARVLQLLAVAFEQGMPVDAALAQLCIGRTAYPSRLVQRRLAAARRHVLSGYEWQDSLERAGLISHSDVVVLRSAQAAGNLPWALRLLAERKVRLAVFRWSVLQQVLFVAIVLLLGLIVFWYAVAMLVPLSDMVINLSG